MTQSIQSIILRFWTPCINFKRMFLFKPKMLNDFKNQFNSISQLSPFKALSDSNINKILVFTKINYTIILSKNIDIKMKAQA